MLPPVYHTWEDMYSHFKHLFFFLTEAECWMIKVFLLQTCSLLGGGGKRIGGKMKKQSHRTQKENCLRLRALGLSCFILAVCLHSSYPGSFGSSYPKPTHILEAMVTYGQISLQHMMCCGRRHLSGHKHILHIFFLYTWQLAFTSRWLNFIFKEGVWYIAAVQCFYRAAFLGRPAVFHNRLSIH